MSVFRTVIIHAGGKNERIKYDLPDLLSKCWLEINGNSIIIQDFLELFDYCNKFVVIVKDELMRELFIEKFNNSPDYSKVRNKIVIEVDNPVLDPNAQGPILSLKTGIQEADEGIIISLPSDLPFISKNLIEEMESHLKNNTLVTIQSEKYFNSLIFMATKKELSLLSSLQWTRVTDIYRLFPNVIFIQLPQNYSDYFIGINNIEEYELAKKLSLTFGNIIPDVSNIKTKSVQRTIDLQDPELFINPKKKKVMLLQKRCYLLTVRLFMLQNLPLDSIPRNIFKLESQLWMNINVIISNHCLKDSKKKLE